MIVIRSSMSWRRRNANRRKREENYVGLEVGSAELWSHKTGQLGQDGAEVLRRRQLPRFSVVVRVVAMGERDFKITGMTRVSSWNGAGSERGKVRRSLACRVGSHREYVCVFEHGHLCQCFRACSKTKCKRLRP